MAPNPSGWYYDERSGLELPRSSTPTTEELDRDVAHAEADLARMQVQFARQNARASYRDPWDSFAVKLIAVLVVLGVIGGTKALIDGSGSDPRMDNFEQAQQDIREGPVEAAEVEAYLCQTADFRDDPAC